MKPLFGEIKQLAFISRDIDRSMRYFLDVWNIGPWYIQRNIPYDNLYRGTPTHINISVALSSAAGMQYEIIQQNDDKPSIYREAIDAVPEGLHVQHVSVWVDDYAKAKADALAKGWQIVLDGRRVEVGEGCYIVHPDEPHLCMEISDKHPAKAYFRRVVEEIANSWDGKDPIREGFPTP
jgi:hypothetical protein